MDDILDDPDEQSFQDIVNSKFLYHPTNKSELVKAVKECFIITSVNCDIAAGSLDGFGSSLSAVFVEGQSYSTGHFVFYFC